MMLEKENIVATSSTDVIDLLEERLHLTIKRVMHIGDTVVRVFNNDSILYEFEKHENSLLMFLTEKGIKKKREIGARALQKVVSLALEGRVEIDSNRSEISSLGETNIVEKRSTASKHMSRLHELINMQMLSESLSLLENEETSDLLVPEYYGFASWKEDGRAFHAIFMEQFPKNRNLREFLESDPHMFNEHSQILTRKLEAAKRFGIKFQDITAGNFFVIDRNQDTFYYIIDQA